MRKKNKKLRNIKLFMMSFLMVILLLAIKIKTDIPQQNDDIGKSCKLEYDYVFFGDSITYRGDWSYFYPNATLINSGINGDRTQDLLNRLKGDVYFYHPKKIIILVGVNDIAHQIDEKITVDNMDKIISRIKTNLPDTKIYLESIYPANNMFFAKKKYKITNSNIMKMNNNYKEIAEKYGITYIDVYSHLIDEKGDLKQIYSKDGLHLSQQGYTAVTEVLNQYIID